MTQEQEPIVIFREIQRFRQPALWLAVVTACVVLVGAVSYPVVSQLLLGKPVARTPLPDAALLLFGGATILLILGLPALLALARLVVEVRLDGLYFRFSPFQRALFRIAPEQLGRFEAKAFRSVGELRAWGGKSLAPRNILTVSGNRGVFLETSAGQSWFIGSQRPEQLVQAIILAFKIPKCRKGMETNC